MYVDFHDYKPILINNLYLWWQITQYEISIFHITTNPVLSVVIGKCF